MDKNNIALVRATNVIPFDGEIKPVSESYNLKSLKGVEFSFGIHDLLLKHGIIPPIDFTRYGDDSYVSEYNKKVNLIEAEYLPLTADYNSMVLFALNGLVPDDSNNIFSNKKCAVIDGLSEHVEEIITIMPTDTAIKGTVKLSNNATILIAKDTFDTLSESEIKRLRNTGLNVLTFTCTLEEAVNQALLSSKRYTPEKLCLTRSSGGYMESDTSEQLKGIIHDVAKEYDIPEVLHFNVITWENDYVDKLQSVKDEYKNSLIIQNYYLERFFQYIFTAMPVSEKLKSMVPSYMNSKIFMEELCTAIETFGLDKYKELVNMYNKELEQERIAGSMMTPEEIIQFVNQGLKRE